VTQHDWAPFYFRLFISHVSARRELAGAISAGLRAHHIDAFVAHDAISPTREWQEEIEDALATCHGCAAILSEGFHESDWCDQEVGVCLGREVLILSIYDGVSPYGFIGSFQALSPGRYAKEEDLCRAIFELLRDNKKSRELMARALVHRYTHSDSHAEAERHARDLLDIPHEAWLTTDVREVLSAPDWNPHLAEADARLRERPPFSERLIEWPMRRDT
jgi:hypothetical protein